MARLHNYYCYQILDPDRQVVYIGTSYAKDAPAILRKHLRGEIPLTAKIFGPSVHQKDTFLHKRPPEYRTKQEADEEADAWHHYFWAQNYHVIRPNCTELPELTYCVREMLKEIRGQSIPDLLFTNDTRNYFSEITGKKVSALHKHAAKPSVVLSVRVSPQTADEFKLLSDDPEYSKGQFLEDMIDQYSGFTSLLYEDLISRLKQLDSSISSTKREHQRQKAALDKKICRLRARHNAIQAMVSAAVKLWWQQNRPSGDPIPLYSRKRARYYCRNRSSYPYPTGVGTALISINYLCYGKSRRSHGQVVFIFATEVVSGKMLKLRCFFRKTLIGRHPKLTEYRNDAVWWQVSYEPAQDGAVDLIGAIPIPRITQCAVLSPAQKSLRNYLSPRELSQDFSDNARETEVSSRNSSSSPQTGLDALIDSAKMRADTNNA